MLPYSKSRSSPSDLQRRQPSMRHMSNLSPNELSMMHPRPAHSNSHQSSSSAYDSSGCKVIPELQNTIINLSMQPPYKKTQCRIQNVTMHCVNMTPYIHETDLLVSVLDFNQKIFPKMHYDMCTRCLSVLKIQQFVLNKDQMRVMETSPRIPFVKANEVSRHIPQLNYMANTAEHQPHSKRQRTS